MRILVTVKDLIATDSQNCNDTIFDPVLELKGFDEIH